jgi:hypothetical protein
MGGNCLGELLGGLPNSHQEDGLNPPPPPFKRDEFPRLFNLAQEPPDVSGGDMEFG